MHDGLVDQTLKFKKRVASLDTSQYKVVKKRQLVVGFPIDEAVLSFQNLYDEAIVSPAYNVWDITDLDLVESRYLEYFLRSSRAIEFYVGKLRGTTARRRSLPNDIFLTLAVPLPTKPEQVRIGEILNLIDGLRAKRRRAIAQLDTLTQTLFLEAFGDPAENPMGWKVGPIADFVLRFQGGKSINSVAGTNVVTQNRVLKVSAVTGMTFIPTESKPVLDTYQPPPEHFVRQGDLLFSRANTRDLVGAVAYVEGSWPNLLLPDKLWRFVWRRPVSVHPLFVWALFQTPALRWEFARRATGTSGSMKNISQKKVLAIPTVLPPLERQKEFAQMIGAAQRLKNTHRKALAELKALDAVVQHRAFRGEL